MSDGVRRLPDSEDERGGLQRDLVMAAAGFGWFDWDVRADHLDFDERMCRLFGIDPATFDHRVATFWAALYPEDLPSVEALVSEALEACGEYSAEYRVALPGGRSAGWRPAARWWPAPTGGRPGCSASRVTRPTSAWRGTPSPGLSSTWPTASSPSTGAGRVTYVNRNAEVFVGAAAEARGRPLWEVWPHLATPGYEPLVRRAASTGQPEVFTKYVVAADRWFQVRVVPHPDGTSFFATDITALRAAELEQERSLSRPDQARAVLAYSAALAEADTLADVIDVVATMVLPAFGATGMLVSLVESNRLKLAGHSGYGARAVELLDVLNADDDVPIAQVLRTREPLFLPSREAYLASFPGRWDVVEATGKQAWAFLPLTVSGRALGSLTISFDGPRDFPPDERSLLVSVSGLLAQTLARARLRDSERTLAAELQQQLLPRALPRPTGLVATARYLAATDGMGVGGDWYDVLELPGDRVALVIGDVQGHTMQAAAVMGQLRNALRAYAAEGHEPGAVMSRTNRLMAELDPGVFATCAIVMVDLRSSRTQLVLAGHPPPVRRIAGGVAELLAAPVGPPLGVVADQEYEPGTVRLGRGDTLVLFTDGLVEDSARSFDEGLATVLATLPRVGDRRPGVAGRPAAGRLGRPGPPLRRRRAARRTPRRPARVGPAGARPDLDRPGGPAGGPGGPGVHRRARPGARAGRPAGDGGAAGVGGRDQRVAAHRRPGRPRAVAVRRPRPGRGLRRDLAQPGDRDRRAARRVRPRRSADGRAQRPVGHLAARRRQGRLVRARPAAPLTPTAVRRPDGRTAGDRCGGAGADRRSGCPRTSSGWRSATATHGGPP